MIIKRALCAIICVLVHCDTINDTPAVETIGKTEINGDVEVHTEPGLQKHDNDDTQESEIERTTEETDWPLPDGTQHVVEPDAQTENKSDQDDDSDIQDVIPPQVNIETFREFVDPIHGSEIASDTANTPPLTDEHQRKRTGKTTKNYAADSCGAKIEKASSDVTNAKNVLSSNKDLYARAPCDKKFSFTVELCEKIQLHRIAVSVDELFASTPSEFLVHAADQAKSDWQEIGRFKIDPSAKSSNGNFLAQSFNVSDPMTHRFVKFLKYEMLSHNSDQNEPLCALTSFQAFGLGEHEGYEVDDDGEEGGDDGRDPIKTVGQAIERVLHSIFIADGSPSINDPSSTKSPIVSSRRLGIRSYQTCWFSSIISRECDIGCDDFKDALFFYYYPGPLIIPEFTPEIEPKKPEIEHKVNVDHAKMITQNSSNHDSTTVITQQPIEAQNKTKTDLSQKKESTDPNHQVLLKQINRLEKNLTWMGSYLETLSHNYKKQMDDVRTSFERTQTRLTKVESSEGALNKSVEQMLDMIRHLYLEVNRLDTTLEKIILAASLVIGLQILLILLHCRPKRDRALHQRLAQIEITLELLKDTTDKAICASAKHVEEQDAKHRRYSDASSNPRTNGLKCRQPKTKNKHKINTSRIGIARKRYSSEKYANDRNGSGNEIPRININHLNVYLTKSSL